MKPRIKPIRFLYFQFGVHCTPKLNSDAVYETLLKLEFIEPAGPGRYRETLRLRALPKDTFQNEVIKLLESNAYLRKGLAK